jgi:glutaredoxin 2
MKLSKDELYNFLDVKRNCSVIDFVNHINSVHSFFNKEEVCLKDVEDSLKEMTENDSSLVMVNINVFGSSRRVLGVLYQPRVKGIDYKVLFNDL